MRDKDKDTRNNNSKQEVKNQESAEKDTTEISSDTSEGEQYSSAEEKTGQENTGNKTDDEKKEKTPDERITELELEIATLKDEAVAMKDTLLRKQADFENIRKRIFKEKEESIKYANQMLLLEITALLDDFERAIKSAEEAKNFDTFHDGIVMIEKQFISTLERKWGIKRFDSSGECFDPDRHLAIAVEESTAHESPTILETYQKGYLFYDRVLRPAKVKVAQPVKKQESSGNEGTEKSSEG